MFPALLVSLLLAAPVSASQGVVVVTVDTLRADHLGFQDDEDRRTPALDRFARSGAVFEIAYSASPATAPAHASLFTGFYPSFHGIGRSNGRYRLTEATPTLARRLRQEGIATAAVISNPVLGRGLGLEQGFDRFDDSLDKTELNRPNREQTAGMAVAKALRELELLVEEPRFLLWLHLQDPHGPYTPPDSFLLPGKADEGSQDVLPLGTDHSGDGAIPRYQQLEEERRVHVYQSRYEAEIAYLDHELAPFLELLETDSRFASTLVIFTADHGEALGEDGYFFAHGHSVGAELTRVPLALVGRGVRPGLRVSGAVSTVSVFATVLEFFGLEATGAQSGSLLHLLDNASPEAAEAVYCESHNQVAVARGGAFLRRDRQEDPSAVIEAEGRPGMEGALRPLPRIFSGGSGAAEMELEVLLESFEQSSILAYESWMTDRIRRKRNRSRDEIEQLRALGYIQ